MIRLASPDIRDADIARVVEVLRSGNLVQGKWVQAFEEALAARTGMPHCAVVSSGTAALHLALLALGVGRGDAVLVPAFTFPATANVVEHVGARPVFCDVDPTTYVATPRSVAAALDTAEGRSAKALIIVHEFGQPADMRAIVALARERGMRVVEDAACAFGSLVEGQPPGHFGDLACYSFHPRKAITTGEGGAVQARDLSLIDMVRRLRNHGIAVTGGRADFVEAGLNYRLTEPQAALGLGQLARFDAELDARRGLASHYVKRLSGLDGVRLPEMSPGHSWQTLMVVLDARYDRDRVRGALLESGIEAGIGAQALNCLAHFRARHGLAPEMFVNATELYTSGLALPLYGKLAAADIDRVCDALPGALARSAKARGAAA